MSERSPGVTDFYDGFASIYHITYGDWDGAVDRWGAALDTLIRKTHLHAHDILDRSCGIGTQAIGLARRGYRVHGTDISAAEIDRARTEAARLDADLSFAVADFRNLSVVGGEYDVVISCDNTLPHLLNDERDVPKALGEMKAKLRPGGLVLITMRDFDKALTDKPPIGLPALIPGPPRRILVRLHEWDPSGAPLSIPYVSSC
jgi:SAM-dependent methyltransferase